MKPRLGVNIDHVATLRRLRDTPYPDLVRAAELCVRGGADQITVHLREDRRHIVDQDVRALKNALKVDLNLEMAATEEMLEFALQIRPHSICVVPEKREERTTEGGLDLSHPARTGFLERIAKRAKAEGILVSFFIEPTPRDVEVSRNLGADAVELHTGGLCLAHQNGKREQFAAEWTRLGKSIEMAQKQGLHLHAGHGIDLAIAPELARLGTIEEFNIGHSIVCEAVYVGLEEATRQMKQALGATR